MDRRAFLRLTGLGAAGLAVRGSLARVASAAPAKPGPGPYGALETPDGNGILLPRGFRSRIIAEGERPVAGKLAPWHRYPDGGATFPLPGGGWTYVSNCEVADVGGAGALRFAPDGTVVDTYRVLTGTSRNCAGGPTPWGTWLSCEEHTSGRVWECDPSKPGQGIERPLLGTFSHEAVAVDPDEGRLYLTEDDGSHEGDGFYRFTPERYPSLDAGRLEIAAVAPDGAIRWIEVDPLVPMQEQRPSDATPFDGAEGVWYEAGHVYFTTKSDNRIWDLDVAAQELGVLYDAAEHGDAAPLTGVDNLTRSRSGDLYIAEDGGNMEVVVLSREGEVTPFLRIEGHRGSEVTGPAFDPYGRRLYFSSQRGPGGRGAGVTYEVSGPFRRSIPADTTSPAGVVPPVPLVAPGGRLASDARPTTKMGFGLLAGAAAAWAGAAGIDQLRTDEDAG